MGLFSKDNLANTTIKDPRDILTNLLKITSGAGFSRSLKYSIFYRVIGFKGATTGVGCSTIVANTALALADLGLTVCVLDTSIQHPIQDTLLKTGVNDSSKDDRLDWFDLGFTTRSCLHVSGRSNSISVLSFHGKGRTVLDMLSTKDSKDLVDNAIDTVQDKFDIVLIDLCDELTKVNIFALQKSQHIIQVWDDSMACLSSLDSTITNNVILSCPMDKMRYVVENKTHDDTIGNMDVLLKQYRFTRLGHCGISTEISRVCSLNRPIWQLPSNDESIIEFTEMIANIVKHICNISEEEEKSDKKSKKPKITSNDIVDGKVEGTLHKKLKDEEAEAKKRVNVTTPDIAKDLGIKRTNEGNHNQGKVQVSKNPVSKINPETKQMKSQVLQKSGKQEFSSKMEIKPQANEKTEKRKRLFGGKNK